MFSQSNYFRGYGESTIKLEQLERIPIFKTRLSCIISWRRTLVSNQLNNFIYSILCYEIYERLLRKPKGECVYEFG